METIGETKEALKGSVGKIISVALNLGDSQSMMYAGRVREPCRECYFIRSLERFVDGAEKFNGVRIPSDEGYGRMYKDDCFMIYSTSDDWPGVVLSMSKEEFRRTKELWDVCMEVGAVSG